ncbi:hypothetical protein NDU88_001040 [Pleurodeles waltl]|uniref:Uncharacterized protein n=1 Tax=Pleurodeles waltl TaxID=8319 RepID=A0AAV7WJA2_PLEWA|nr:hypothetical protein NDU88_001040 [Pleurodeles waltl]
MHYKISGEEVGPPFPGKNTVSIFWALCWGPARDAAGPPAADLEAAEERAGPDCWGWRQTAPRLKPRPRVNPRAAAEEERTARVQRETLLRSPCCGKGTEAASGGPWALGGLRPESQRCSEAGEAGVALDRAGAGPRMNRPGGAL